MLKQKSQKQNIESWSHAYAVVSEEVFVDIYLIPWEKGETAVKGETEAERTIGLYVLH